MESNNTNEYQCQNLNEILDNESLCEFKYNLYCPKRFIHNGKKTDQH